MSSSKQYNSSDFTRDNYRRLLRLAKDNYTFCMFTDFRKVERCILWRHDVDFSLHASLKLSCIEADEGLMTTYFLHLHNIFYNLLERENRDITRKIIACGHQIGLHFDCDFYNIKNEDELVNYLFNEKRILEDIFGQEIKAFSFHNPTPFTLKCNQWEYAGMINSYAEFFQKEVGYCSDSNGYWRHQRLEDVLKRAHDKRLQVLTHPVWWHDTIMPPKEKAWRCVEGRAEKTKQWYEEILKASGRENVDWD